MGISMSQIVRYAIESGADMSKAAAGIKLTKKTTSDGSAGQLRLAKIPHGLDDATFVDASRWGITVAGSEGAKYVRGLSVTGAAAMAMVAAAARLDGEALEPEETPPEPVTVTVEPSATATEPVNRIAELTAAEPEPVTADGSNNGRKNGRKGK